MLTTGLGDNDHADGSTVVGGRASATADLEETIGCSPSSVSAEQGTLQNTLPPPHKDLSVDEVMQQSRTVSPISEKAMAMQRRTNTCGKTMHLMLP